jgi:catechol 2,3-dioxygenase-like lactoylglutathione lyase family enzyme
MILKRMGHVGIVVDDLAAATEFFVELGLVLQGEGPVEGRWADRVVGLDGVRAEIAMMQTPDGNGRLELTKFHSPSTPAELVGELERYEDRYRLCYVRDPEGIIIELAADRLAGRARCRLSEARRVGAIHPRPGPQGLSHVRLTPTVGCTVRQPDRLTGHLLPPPHGPRVARGWTRSSARSANRADGHRLRAPRGIRAARGTRVPAGIGEEYGRLTARHACPRSKQRSGKHPMT